MSDFGLDSSGVTIGFEFVKTLNHEVIVEMLTDFTGPICNDFEPLPLLVLFEALDILLDDYGIASFAFVSPFEKSLQSNCHHTVISQLPCFEKSQTTTHELLNDRAVVV